MGGLGAALLDLAAFLGAALLDLAAFLGLRPVAPKSVAVAAAEEGCRGAVLSGLRPSSAMAVWPGRSQF